jgi:hypothetical protein
MSFPRCSEGYIFSRKARDGHCFEGSKELAMKRLRLYFLSSFSFMTIGAPQRTALHFLMTTHALKMVCAFKPYTWSPLNVRIVIDSDNLMAFPTCRGRTLRAMVVAACTIAGHFCMITVREFNRSVSLRQDIQREGLRYVGRVCQGNEQEDTHQHNRN